jgi:hypothetical protein
LPRHERELAAEMEARKADLKRELEFHTREKLRHGLLVG